jgi:hypothetical protein
VTAHAQVRYGLHTTVLLHLAVLFVVGRRLLRLEPRAVTSRHAVRGTRESRWPTLVWHYVVAAVVRSRVESYVESSWVRRASRLCAGVVVGAVAWWTLA